MDEQRADAPVIFRPLVEKLTNERQQRSLAPQRMTDHGDHVEWTNGKQTWRWRLPDQANNGTDYPVMTTVVLGETQNPIAPNGVASYHFLFTDADGVILGRLTGGIVQDVPYPMFPALPEQAFEQLVRRGVSVTREKVTGLRQLYKAHPDPSRRKFPFFGRG